MDRLNNILIITFFFLLLVFPQVTQGATLYLIPQSQTIYQDDTFIIEVRLDTEGKEINTVEASLIFPPYLLEALDFIKGDSILTLFVEEPKIQKGEISFAAGIPNGFKGEGLLIKVSFLGKEIGREDISFKEDSKVLLNDGKGTPAQLSFQEGNYEIIKRPAELPVITSETHPDQNKWYKLTTLHFHWNLIEGAEYSYLLSYDPLAEPDETPDRPEGELIWMGDMEYKGLEDGIYYFTLKQKLPGKDWSGVARFRAMIDATPPEEFELQIGQDPAVFEGKYFLSFTTQDRTSGVDHYEISETPRTRWKSAKEEWRRAESPYLLEDQTLRSIIKVRAVDKAGNERIAEIVPPYKVTWKDIVIPLLILIGIIVVWWIIHRFIQK